MTTTITIFIGSLGALSAWLVGAPAPFLTGPATFVTVSALIFQIKCQIAVPVRNISFVIIGISTAEGINSKVLDNIIKWPISLIGMICCILLLVISGKYLFQTFFKMGRSDAILASAPGHLSYVLSLSESGSGNTVVISVVQSIRVLTLTLVVPATVTFFTDFDIQKPIPNKLILTYTNLIILITLAGLTGFLLLQFKTPAAFLLGGMFCSTIGHGFELTPGAVPEYLATLAFIVLGSLIGSRFTGISLKIFTACVIKGVSFTGLSLIISVHGALIISNLTDFRFIEVLIALAPGGLETMVVMGQLVGADPAFVAFHHLARLFLLLFILSLLIKK